MIWWTKQKCPQRPICFMSIRRSFVLHRMMSAMVSSGAGRNLCWSEENKNQREITRKLAMDHDNLNDRFSLLQHLGGRGNHHLWFAILKEKYRLEVDDWIEKLALSYFPRGNMFYYIIIMRCTRVGAEKNIFILVVQFHEIFI